MSFQEEEGGKSECAVIEQCRLRLHREWVDANWVPPLPLQKVRVAIFQSIFFFLNVKFAILI